MLASGAFACGGTGPAKDIHTLQIGSSSQALLDEPIPTEDVIGNGLSPASLVAHGLHRGTLSLDGMDPEASAAILDVNGFGARQLFKYAVSCALDASSSVSFSWTDAAGTVHNEVYNGLVALAPNWQYSPLGQSGQEWVSACLAARTNYYARAVALAVEGATISDTSVNAVYPQAEGAFWGNIFASTPHLHACMNPSQVDASRARLRECAAGHVDAGSSLVQPCGIITLMGDCLGPALGDPANGANCQLVNDNYMSACSGATATQAFPQTNAVLTVYLPSVP